MSNKDSVELTDFISTAWIAWALGLDPKPAHALCNINKGIVKFRQKKG